jgi:hypothetical protein
MGPFLEIGLELANVLTAGLVADAAMITKGSVVLPMRTSGVLLGIMLRKKNDSHRWN